jgi:DNA-binding Lrp family transcriptional regulator
MVHKKISSFTELDTVNKRIIRLLRNDAKKPYKDIAHELGVSESTVRKRVNNLLSSGVIEKFTIDISPQFVKQNITAFITIIPRAGEIENLIDLLSVQSYCSEIFVLNGRMGLLMIVGTENAEELNALLEAFRVDPSIQEVTAGISLRNIKTGNCVAKLF